MIIRLRKIWFRDTVRGSAVFPFIFLKTGLSEKEEIRIINHERIHHRQQLEMLYIPFFIWYFASLLLPSGYKEMSLEQECRAHENDLDYLSKRKPFAWTKYLNYGRNR